MDSTRNKLLEGLMAGLKDLSQPERIRRLWDLEDQALWQLMQMECQDALVVLFRKYHRQIVILTYHRMGDVKNIRLELVQDAFSEFIERMLAGRYRDESLIRDFTAFSVYHISFLVRSKLKRVANSRIDPLGGQVFPVNPAASQRIETRIDLEKVIDLIPKVSNHVYRMVLYLIFVVDYNSADLSVILGQKEKAYDKRSRALKAFRKLLAAEGYLDELTEWS